MRPSSLQAFGAAWTAALVLPTAGAGYSATTTITFTGTTSQGEPMSFAASGGYLRRLRFRVDVTCPSHRRYSVKAWGFSMIQIVHSRFSQIFKSTSPNATATIVGKITRRRRTAR